MSFAQYPIFDIPEGADNTIIETESDVIILVNQADYTEENKGLLTKILGAAKKDIHEAKVILRSDPGHSYTLRSTKDTLVISFDISPKALSLQIDPARYLLHRLGHETYLFVASLSHISSSKPDKSALWQSLKTYYNI